MISSFPQFVPNDACLHCEGCCRFIDTNTCFKPKVADSEICPEFKKHVDKDNFFATCQYNDRVKCEFFNPSNNKCEVYNVRPFECRLYPFLLVKKNNGIVLGVHLSCPYVLDNHNTKQFDEYVLRLKQFFQVHQADEFLKGIETLAGDYSQYSDEIEELSVIQN